MTRKPTATRRVYCIGPWLDEPCADHASWEEEPHPGSITRRCHACKCKRVWREKDHPTHCVVCGDPLPKPGSGIHAGRPRKYCFTCHKPAGNRKAEMTT